MGEKLKLSNRMKEILFLLSRTGEYKLTRNHIIHAIEREKWLENTKESTVEKERLLKDSVRVSYDRTFAKLKKLGLIEGGFMGYTPFSFYEGTLYRGHLYILTEKGREMADEIIKEILEPINRFDKLFNDLSDL
jgi:hypothetical protein